MMQIPNRIDDDKSRVDAIVVLTGGSERITTGVDLLVKDVAPIMFISGVGKGVRINDLAPSISSYDQSRITLGFEAGDTVGNARETANWIKRNNIKAIRLVTGSYHMPRSLSEFRQAMPDVTVIPNPVFPENIKTSEWWRYKGTTELLIREYHKYCLSYFHALTRYI